MRSSSNIVRILSAASIRVTLVVCIGMPILPRALGDEINESFRDSHLNQMAFGVVGDRALMTPSTDGLRIASTSESQGNTGIVIPQEIHGDFEINAKVTLQDFPVPANGYGTGFAILVENAMNHGASLQLVVMPDGAKTIVAHDFEIVNGEHQHHATTFPAASSALMLRLRRRGDTLYYRFPATMEARLRNCTTRILWQHQFESLRCTARQVAIKTFMMSYCIHWW